MDDKKDPLKAIKDRRRKGGMSRKQTVSGGKSIAKRGPKPGRKK